MAPYFCVESMNFNIECKFKKFVFQCREDGLKLETKERSVVKATWAQEVSAESHIRRRLCR